MRATDENQNNLYSSTQKRSELYARWHTNTTLSRDIIPKKKAIKKANVCDLVEYKRIKQLEMIFIIIKDLNSDNMNNIIDAITGTWIPYTKYGVRQLFECIIDQVNLFSTKSEILCNFLIELLKNSDPTNHLGRLTKLLDQSIQKIQNNSINFILYCNDAGLFKTQEIRVNYCAKDNYGSNNIVKDRNEEGVYILKIYNREEEDPVKKAIEFNDFNLLSKLVNEEKLKNDAKKYEKYSHFDPIRYSAICCAINCYKYLKNLRKTYKKEDIIDSICYNCLESHDPAFVTNIAIKFHYVELFTRARKLNFLGKEYGEISNKIDFILNIFKYKFTFGIEHIMNCLSLEQGEITKVLDELIKNRDFYSISLWCKAFDLNNEIKSRLETLIKTKQNSTLKALINIIDEVDIDLLQMAKTKNRKAMKILFEKIGENNEKYEINLISQALRLNSDELIQFSLRITKDINNPNDVHPLYVAVENNNIDQVKILVSVEGIDVNSTNCGFSPPLCLAMMNKRREIVDLLLSDKRIDVSCESFYGSPLVISCKNKDIDLIRFLIERFHVDVNHESICGSLLYVSCHLGDYEFYKTIKDLPGLFIREECTEECFNPLYGCSSSGNADIVVDIISSGIEVNSSSCEGPALLGAVSHGHLSIVRILIEHGADYNRIYQNISPLLLAVTHSNLEIVEYLLSLEAIVIDGEKCIRTASKNNDIPILRLLLEKIDKISSAERDSAYACAILHDCTDLIRILNRKGPAGFILLDSIALPQETLEALIEGDRIDLTTPHFLEQAISLEMIDYIKLVNNKMDLKPFNMKENNFLSPVEECKNQEILDILLDLNGFTISEGMISLAIQYENNYFLKELFTRKKELGKPIDYISIALKGKNQEMIKFIYESCNIMTRKIFIDYIKQDLYYLSEQTFRYLISQNEIPTDAFLYSSIEYNIFSFFEMIINYDVNLVNYADKNKKTLLSTVCEKNLIQFIGFLLDQPNILIDKSDILACRSTESFNLIFNCPKFDIKSNLVTILPLLQRKDIQLNKLLINDKFREVMFEKHTINDVIQNYNIYNYVSELIELYVTDYYELLTTESKQALMDSTTIRMNNKILSLLYMRQKLEGNKYTDPNLILDREMNAKLINLELIRELLNDPDIKSSQKLCEFILINNVLHDYIPKFIGNQVLSFFSKDEFILKILGTYNLEIIKYLCDIPELMTQELILRKALVQKNIQLIHLLLNKRDEISGENFVLAIDMGNIFVIKRMMKIRKNEITYVELLKAVESANYKTEIVKLILSTPKFQIFPVNKFPRPKLLHRGRKSRGKNFYSEHPLVAALNRNRIEAAELIAKHKSFFLDYNLVEKLITYLSKVEKIIDFTTINLISLLINRKNYGVLCSYLYNPFIQLKYETGKYHRPIEELLCYFQSKKNNSKSDALAILLLREDIKINIDFNEDETIDSKIKKVYEKFPKNRRKYSFLTNKSRFQQLDSIYNCIQETEEDTIENTIDAIFGTYAPYKESGVRKIFNFIFTLSTIIPKKLKIFVKLFIELSKQSDESNCLGILINLLKQVRSPVYNLIMIQIVTDIDFLDKSLKINKSILNSKFEPIHQIIIDDDIESLQEISREINFNINQAVSKPNYMDQNIFQSNITLLDFASICGSVKCFKYLLVNGAKMPEKDINQTKYPIYGQNIEIIRIFEQNNYEFNLESINAISIRNREIFTWIMERKKLSKDDYDIYQELDLIVNKKFYLAFEFFEKYQEIEKKELKSILERSLENNNYNVFKFVLKTVGLKLSPVFSNKTLMDSIKFSDLKIFKYILKNINLITIDDQTIKEILEISYKSWNPDVLFAILDYDIYDKEIISPNFINKALNRSEMATVKKLLSYEQYDFQNKNDVHPLYVAVKNNSIDQVKILVSVEGIDVNSTNCGFSPPLCLAMMNKHREIVDLLLSDKRIDVNRESFYGSPLVISCKNKDIDLIRFLIERFHVDVNHESICGSLLYVSCNLGDYEFYKTIKDLPGLFIREEYTEECFNPLYGCSSSGNVDIVVDIISSGIEVNSSSCEGPALLGAVSHGHLSIVRILIEHGADYKYKTAEGLRYIFIADIFHFYDLFKYLLTLEDEDEDMSLLSCTISSGLHEYYSLVLQKFKYKNLNQYIEKAVVTGNIQLFNELISHVEIDSDVETVISNGLYELAIKQSIMIIKEILKIPNLKLDSGKILCAAVESQNIDILQCFLNYNTIDVNSVYQETTALGLACKTSNYYLTKLLLKVPGINVNLGNPRPIEQCDSKSVFGLLYDQKEIDLFFDDCRLFNKPFGFYFVKKILNDERFKNITNDKLNRLIALWLEKSSENEEMIIPLKKSKLKQGKAFSVNNDDHKKDILYKFKTKITIDLDQIFQFLIERKDFQLNEEATKAFLRKTICHNNFTLFKAIIDATGFAITKDFVDGNIIKDTISNSKNEFMLYFLEKCSDINVNVKIKYDYMPLAHCIKCRNFEVFKALINYGTTDVNFKVSSTLFSQTLSKREKIKYYHLFLDHSDFKITSKILLELLNDFDLHSYAFKYIDHPDIDINFVSGGLSCLKAAIQTRDFELYKKIANHPKIVFEEDIFGFACFRGSAAIILDLLHKNDVLIGENVLVMAFKDCSFRVIKEIIESEKFKMKSCMKQQEEEVLLKAIEKNDVNLAKYLLNRPTIDIYKKINDGSYLKKCILSNKIEIADLIMQKHDKGFDNEIIKVAVNKNFISKLLNNKYFNKTQNILLSLMSIRGDKEIIDMLLNVPGIDVNYYEEGYYPPLTAAIMLNREDVVRKLVDVPGIKFEFEKIEISPFFATSLKKYRNIELFLLEKSGLDESILQKYRKAVLNMKYTNNFANMI